jgi:hypothetical protein
MCVHSSRPCILVIQPQDKGAISSVNLLKNAIPVEQVQELLKILQSKEKLATLCGLSGNEATLDFSNQGIGPGDAVLIANDISDMGALTSLNLSSNNIGEVDEDQAIKDVEVLLQSFGIGLEALQEHFEVPEDGSTTAMISMVSTHGLFTYSLLGPLTTRLPQIDCCCP